MNCAICGGKRVGKVGVEQYFCWDCCIEFKSQPDQVIVYDLEEDGTLVMWEDFSMNCQELQQMAAE